MSLRVNCQRLYNLGIIFLPAFFWPWAKIPYEVPKVYLFNIWVGVLTVLTAILLYQSKVVIKMKGQFALPAFIFIIIAILSAIFGVNFLKSLFGNYYRTDGLITLINLFLFSILTSIYRTPKITNLITVGIILTLLIDHFGNPNFFGGYLAVSLPFVFSSSFSFLSIPIFIFIILTKSWAAIIVSLLSFASWGLIKSKNRKNVVLFSLVPFLLAIIVFGIYFVRYEQNKRTFIGGYLPESRGRILTKALLAVRQRPILGWGWANFDYVFKTIDWPMKYNNDLYVDKAHSTFAEAAATTGLIGLASYLFLIYRMLKNTSNKFILMSLILYLLHSQTNVISISEEMYFWLILGLL